MVTFQAQIHVRLSVPIFLYFHPKQFWFVFNLGPFNLLPSKLGYLRLIDRKQFWFPFNFRLW